MADDTLESKDFFALVNDAIEKYSKAISAILGKEAEKYGDVSNGQIYLLREVETVSYFNATILRGLVNTLLKNSVIGSLAVVHWVLGDTDEGSEIDIASRWWLIAIDAFDAIQEQIRPVEWTDGIPFDGSSAEISVSTAREKMLTYSVKRVCSLLATRSEKRLDSMQVDLLEGMKSLTVRSKDTAAESRIGSLADLCSGFGGSMAVELLKSILTHLQAES